MAFSLPSDPGYRRAQRIRRGDEGIDPAFDGFVAAFTARFSVAPLDVGADVVAGPGGATPRLGVVLERTEQHRRFCRRNGAFVVAKQRATAAMLVERVATADLRRLFDRATDPDPGPAAEDVFVHFEDFERVAVRDAFGSVTDAELAGFAAALGLADRLWRVERFDGPPVVLVRTEAQADALRASDLPQRWADQYVPVVQRHDEFGYVRREDVTVGVLSKERFDTEHGGQWIHYLR